MTQGFSQVPGTDFNETFAPVSNLTTIYLVLIIATHKNYEIHQIDFDSAYSNANLTEEIC